MHYPYFINPDIEALPSAQGEERVKLMRHIAVCVGDEAALRALIGIDPEEFKNFYPDMNPPELSTEDTISNFIDRFASEKKAETPEIENIIAAPATNYALMIEEEENEVTDTADDAAADATSDAISAFLQAVPPKAPKKKTVKTEEKATVPEDTDLSDALFKLMVKNRNYVKALEIINEISLKNPKKSVYFAYQKRFLQKLIANESGEAAE